MNYSHSNCHNAKVGGQGRCSVCGLPCTEVFDSPLLPLHHIEGISERCDEKFPDFSVSSHEQDCECSKCTGSIDKDKVKSHILTEYLTFIDGMIEEVDGMKMIGNSPKGLPYENSPEIYGCKRLEAYKMGHNDAQSKLLSSLKSYREIISKQMK